MWYALNTPNPRKVVTALRAEGWYAWTPMLICDPRSDPKRPNPPPVTKPVFQGYTFVFCHEDHLSEVLHFQGVSGCVRKRVGPDLVPAVIPTGDLRDVFIMELFGAFDRRKRDDHGKRRKRPKKQWQKLHELRAALEVKEPEMEMAA